MVISMPDHCRSCDITREMAQAFLAVFSSVPSVFQAFWFCFCSSPVLLVRQLRVRDDPDWLGREGHVDGVAAIRDAKRVGVGVAGAHIHCRARLEQERSVDEAIGSGIES